MSWDKNTVRVSGVDAMKDVLDNLGIGYEISTITKVLGRGLNDGMWGEETYHEIRRLAYSDFIILEQIEQDADCDTDDIITSRKFKLSDEPSVWEPIISTDKTGQYT